MNEDIVVSNLALERARALRSALAVQDDRRARTALAALVCAGTREECVDHRDGSAQTLVALADPDGSAPWGFAVCKGPVVVTVVDPDGARYLRARGKRPATRPRLRRVDAEADELSRFEVTGCASVGGLVVSRDGGVELVGVGPGGRCAQ